MTTPLDAGDRRAAFTLLEVLAAVAILGILYTVLAGVAIRGLRSEADARLRLEATLLADERLTALEAQLALGVVPEVGEEETDEEPFFVRVEVTPLELTLPPDPRQLGRGGSAEPVFLLGSDLSGGEPLVRQIAVTVSWLDGEDEKSVSRTTYGYDAALVAGLVPEPASQGQAAGGRDPQDPDQQALEDFAERIGFDR